MCKFSREMNHAVQNIWANTNGPLLFTCFGGRRKCGVWWAIMPRFQGPARPEWTSGDCPQGVRPADGPGTHSLASTGPFSKAAVHRASGLLRFSQSQRGRIMDRKWGCPQYVRNRKLMSRSCPGNATATLLAALTFFVKNKQILL